jgi:hypothetical protein
MRTQLDWTHLTIKALDSMSETNQNGWIVRDNTGIAVYGVVNGDLRIRHETYNGDIAGTCDTAVILCLMTDSSR